MIFNAVLFDLIGTVVKESDPDTINNCFKDAFTENGILVSIELVKANRGKSKFEIIDTLLEHSNGPVELRKEIDISFRKNVRNNIDNFIPNDGIEELLLHLRKKNVITGLGTGLSQDLFDKILNNLNWDEKTFDYINNAERCGHGRPHPAMIHDMMKKFKITDKTGFLKVGDTAADIHEGKNAGVVTAIILSGTQSKEELEKEKPDFVLENLSAILKLI